MLIILLFTLILNIVKIKLKKYKLKEKKKKEKLVYIVVGTAIIYILTSIVYWISTNKIEITEVSERGKDLITFLFVPINAIIILPLLASSYRKFKDGELDKEILIKRGIILGVILLVFLIIECIYFKNIQQQVVDMLNEQEQHQQQQEQNILNEINSNTLNSIETEIVNDTNIITNQINQVIDQNIAI